MPYLIVDRFEEEFAVCEDEQGYCRLLFRTQLPDGAGEGSVLCECEDGTYTLDAEETERRRARIAALQDELFH